MTIPTAAQASPKRGDSARSWTSYLFWNQPRRSYDQRSRRDRQRLRAQPIATGWADGRPFLGRNGAPRRTSVRVAALGGWALGNGDPGPARRYARGGGGSHASTSCLPGSIRAKLAAVDAKFGPIQVISTHRPGATIRGSGRPSYHRWCRAADFRPRPGTYGAVVSYLRSTWSGGVLTYRSGHIHIDDGPGYRLARR